VGKKQGTKEKVTQSEARMRKQILLLWAILGEGGGKDVSRSSLEKKAMLPSDDKAARDALEAQGLIKVEPRSSRNDLGRPVKGLWISVTDDGRAWAEENLAAVPAKAFAAAPILQAWLTRLSAFISTHHLSLKDVLEPRYAARGESERKQDAARTPTPEPAPTPAPDYEALRKRIRRTYLDLTGGRLNTRALLADLREKLTDVPRPALDEALKRMQREEEASLYQLDNQVEVTDADRAAAIHFGGEPRHILWIER
jgi:hypothetical protein